MPCTFGVTHGTGWGFHPPLNTEQPAKGSQRPTQLHSPNKAPAPWQPSHPVPWRCTGRSTGPSRGSQALHPRPPQQSHVPDLQSGAFSCREGKCRLPSPFPLHQRGLGAAHQTPTETCLCQYQGEKTPEFMDPTLVLNLSTAWWSSPSQVCLNTPQDRQLTTYLV